MSHWWQLWDVALAFAEEITKLYIQQVDQPLVRLIYMQFKYPIWSLLTRKEALAQEENGPVTLEKLMAARARLGVDQIG